MKVRVQTQLFFWVEISNDGGVQPATLGSAYDSFRQASHEQIQTWCGYKVKAMDDDESENLYQEVGKEIRKLIRRYGKRQELESLDPMFMSFIPSRLKRRN
jgi:hypothetical protein